MVGRSLPQLVPLVVTGLVLELLASGGPVDLAATVLLGVGAWMSVLPNLLGVHEERDGARRVVLLCGAVSAVLVAHARPVSLSWPLELAAALAWPWLGALAVDLAFDVPDRPAAFGRLRPLRVVSHALAAVGVVTGLLVTLPPWGADRAAWVVPASWAVVPPAVVFAQLLLALGLRSVRGRAGSGAEALAAGHWSVLGLASSASAFAVATLVIAWGGQPATGAVVRGLLGAGGASLALGHVLLLDGRRPIQAASTTRKVLAALTVFVAVGWTVGRLAHRIPDDGPALGVWTVTLLVVSAIGYRAVSALFDRVLAPAQGRLLRAIDRAEAALSGARTLDEVAAAVIAPLRRAAQSPDARPFLQTLAPARQAGVDAAGMPKVEARDLAPALVARMHARPGETLVAAPLRAASVRRPELRPLLEALENLEALAVVPLAAHGELEGALVVARGTRRAALTLEEIAGLERLGGRLSGLLAMQQVEARAQERAGKALLAATKLEDRIDALDDELVRLRLESRVWKAGRAADRRAAPAVAYSPAMRALTARIAETATVDAPVTLLGEAGNAIEGFGHLVHAASARRDGPFVVADCASIRPDRSLAALVGDEGEAGDHPGWLRLAGGGTLMLVDAPAMSLAAQAALTEAFASRAARSEGGRSAYAVDVRVLVHSRVDVRALVEAGTFDPDLARRIEPLRLEIPSLRDRREDLPSLVLLALDRACRTLGREVMGIEEHALARLLSYAWPGNLRELQTVIDRAVLTAQPPRVQTADLSMPVEAPEPPSEDPLDGTWIELEQRILRAALEKAAGNKSEAARLLGLKRTTFLDKLRRAGFEDRESVPPDAP